MPKRLVVCCDGTWNRPDQLDQGIAAPTNVSKLALAVARLPLRVANYEPGDELFFFGFSRGAFTARSTVRLVRNSGILRREHAGRIDEAYPL